MNIGVHTQDKYQKDRIKTEGAYSIWNNVDGRTTGGRTMNGSASDNSLWRYIAPYIWVEIGSGKGSLPDGTRN